MYLVLSTGSSGDLLIHIILLGISQKYHWYQITVQLASMFIGDSGVGYIEVFALYTHSHISIFFKSDIRVESRA